METQFFAVFSKNGLVRTTKRTGSVGARQVGVFIHVDIPDSAFDDGHLHANIKVPPNAYVLPDIAATLSPIAASRDNDGEQS